MYFGGVPSDRSYRKSYVIWVKQCHTPAMTGNGLSWFIHTTYKHIKLVMTGFIWFITGLPGFTHIKSSLQIYSNHGCSPEWLGSDPGDVKGRDTASPLLLGKPGRTVRSQPSRHVPTGVVGGMLKPKNVD